MVKELAEIIRNYESDTFNAKNKKVTHKEARQIAESLLEDFRKMVQEGGRMYCDGLLLEYRLEGIRIKVNYP